MKLLLSTLVLVTIIAGGKIVESKQDRKNNENLGLWGACCLPDGSCVMEYATMCYANYEGIFIGGECSENPCPDPMGACCNTQGWEGELCEDVTEDQCTALGGYFQGGATECETSICEWDAVGACCLPYGGCAFMTYQDCAYEHGDDGMGGFDPNNWSAYTPCEESDCSPTCNPNGFFDNIAYPLTIACQDGPTQFPGIDPATPDYFCETWDSYYYLQMKVDLNGDGASETVMGLSCAQFDSGMPEMSNKRNGRVLVAGDKAGTVEMLDLLDVSLDNMSYADFDDSGDGASFHLVDFLDVTGDGLVDAIIILQTYDEMGSQIQVPYYVENISTPKGVACATDVNNDGNTDTSDMLALIAGWGPCE